MRPVAARRGKEAEPASILLEQLRRTLWLKTSERRKVVLVSSIGTYGKISRQMLELIAQALIGPLRWEHGFAATLAVVLVVTITFRAAQPKEKAVIYQGRLLICPWTVMSVLWIAGVVCFESLDGFLFQEIGEVIVTAFVPTIVPPLVMVAVIRTIGH